MSERDHQPEQSGAFEGGQHEPTAATRPLDPFHDAAYGQSAELARPLGGAAADPAALQAAQAGADGGGGARRIALPFRAQLERAFGADLSDVEAYVGPAAETANDAHESEALAVGPRILLRDENPELELVAHEVAHLVQQGTVTQRSRADQPTEASGVASHEQEADAVAEAVVAGESVEVAGRAPVSVQTKKRGKGKGKGKGKGDKGKGDKGKGKGKGDKGKASLPTIEPVLEMPTVMTDNGQPVRTGSAQGPGRHWAPLGGAQTIIQGLQVEGLEPGDAVRLRVGSGVTNDIATKDAEKGSRGYKGENRYTVAVEGVVLMGDALGAGAPVAQGRTVIAPENHHGQVDFAGEVAADPSQKVFTLALTAQVKGGPTPSRDVGRKGQPGPPGGYPSLIVEPSDKKTRLDALVESAGAAASVPRSELHSDDSHLVATRVERGQPVVSISLPLGAVRAGEILDAQSVLDVLARSKQKNQLATHQILLCASPTDLTGERLTIKHGRNVKPGGTDVVRKFGTLTVTRDYPEAYLNVVVNTMSDISPGDRLEVQPGSSVSVTRYSPP